MRECEVKRSVVVTGVLQCVFEPRGAHGLEGYQRGSQYPFKIELATLYYNGRPGKRVLSAWVRPSAMTPDYWEVLSVNNKEFCLEHAMLFPVNDIPAAYWNAATDMVRRLRGARPRNKTQKQEE